MSYSVGIDGVVTTLSSADGGEWPASRSGHFTPQKRGSCTLLVRVCPSFQEIEPRFRCHPGLT
jgi:hypothetical protein